MPTSEPFERYPRRYDEWFERYEPVYRSEVNALERFVPASGRSLEVGVGTGRFAEPLGIEVGVDPAVPMLIRARDRGVRCVAGVAESLPFGDGRFRTVLLVTTVCFVDDLERTLAEARRVLDPAGSLVVGYVDPDSPVGRIYRERTADNPFYEDAEFVPTRNLVEALEAAGFVDPRFVQTLFRWIDAVEEPEPVEEGHGDGSFVALGATPAGDPP